jgi:hypothetical protein
VRITIGLAVVPGNRFGPPSSLLVVVSPWSRLLPQVSLT